MDLSVINEVRDLLFNEVIPGVGGGQDLVALDIQTVSYTHLSIFKPMNVVPFEYPAVGQLLPL